jgi:hypothetical protein
MGSPPDTAADSTPGIVATRFEDPTEESGPRRRVRVPLLRQRELHRQGVAGIEPRRHPGKAYETVQQKPRSRQQDQGESQLGHDQAAGGPVTAAGDGAATRLLQLVPQVGSGSLERRDQPEGQPGGDGDDQGKSEHIQVHTDLLHAGHVGGGGLPHRRDAAIGQRDAQHGAAEREQNAFRQELPDDTPPRRAERQPHRDLLPP